MIAAADVQDQELSVRSVGRRIYNPPIAWGGNLGPRPGRNRGSLLAAPSPIRGTEFTYPTTAGGQSTPAVGGNKDSRRPHAARVLQGRKAGTGLAGRFRILAWTGPDPRRAAGAVQTLLEFSDQIFEFVHLPRQGEGPLALGRDGLFDFTLPLLAVLDQGCHAFLGIGKLGQLAGQLVALVHLFLFHARQVGELDQELVGLAAHLRQYGAKRHRGSHRFDRILGW